MKYIKICSLLLIVLLTIGGIKSALENTNAKTSFKMIDLVSSNNKSIPKDDKKTEAKLEIPKTKVLSTKDLTLIFPDEHFRDVVCRHFKNEEITLEKIENLSGELYATGEYIKSIEGISYLKNIEKFIFWNNEIKILPEEILSLDKVKSINLANNFLVEDTITDKLKDKKVDINCDLNFIKDEKNQYSLMAYKDLISLKVGQELELGKAIYRDIQGYDKYWEILMQMPVNTKYDYSIDDKNVISCDGLKIKALSKGESKITLTLDDTNNKQATVSFNVKVE